MTKSVVKKQQENLPVASGEFDEFAGAGMENVTSNDLLVPRLTILQDLSPQIKKNKSEYIEGAQVGHICDVGTGELFADGVMFLPVYYRKDYLEWAPRASGKGLVAIHTDPAVLDDCTLNEKKQNVTPSGNYISETAQFYGFNITADLRKCFIPMPSTQLKKARKWLTLSTGEKLKRADGTSFTPPLFYRIYQLTTAIESNNEGEWYGWVIERSVSLPQLGKIYPGDWHEVKQAAADFLAQLRSGEARADTSHLDEQQTSEAAM